MSAVYQPRSGFEFTAVTASPQVVLYTVGAVGRRLYTLWLSSGTSKRQRT